MLNHALLASISSRAKKTGPCGKSQMHRKLFPVVSDGGVNSPGYLFT